MLFHFNWKLSLFVVLCLPLLITAGFWQIQRGEQKHDMQQALLKLQHSPAVDYLQLPVASRTNYRNVTVKGILQDQIFLLDNQIFKGVFGYEVIQLLEMEHSQHLLISRGWVKGDLNRQNLPVISTSSQAVQLTGYLYAPTKNIQLDSSALSSHWPRRVQTASLEFLLAQLNNKKVPEDYLLRLNKNSAAALASHWSLIPLKKEKHIAYAVQWFALALLLLGLFIYSSVAKGRQDLNQPIATER